MAEEQKKVLETMSAAMQKLQHKDFSYLLGFGDGALAAASLEDAEQEEPEVKEE